MFESTVENGCLKEGSIVELLHSQKSDLPHSLKDTETSRTVQEQLYGEIQPAPMKQEQSRLTLPKLDSKLVFPKQRKRSASIDARFYHSEDKENDRLRVAKRPSTCGKEGIRHFSSPLPFKVNLKNYSIPNLSPRYDHCENIESSANSTLFTIGTDTSSANSTNNSSFQLNSPIIAKSEFTSPLSTRNFSTPMSVVRDNGLLKTMKQFDPKTPIQTKLKQATKKDSPQIKIRQVKREIFNLQREIEVMKRVKKYRNSSENEKLDESILKWRDIAQMASNYMLNEARNKISQMGGIDSFKERQKKAKQRKMKFEFDDSMLYKIEDYMETEEYKELGKYEKEEILSKKRELEEMSEKLENGEFPVDESEDELGDNNDEFSMKDLYKQLKLDYNLVYED